MTNTRRAMFSTLVIIPLLSALPAGAGEAITIFAAASTREAVSDAAAAFSKRTEIPIIPVFAATSLLARQILDGAPADIFVSANRAWSEHLVAADMISATNLRVIAGNRLVLASGDPHPNPITDPKHLPQLLVSERLAMADPNSVPAGIYAREALTGLGIWQALADRLAPTADVRRAMTLAQRREVPFAILYGSDLFAAKDLHEMHSFAPNLHSPIVYLAGLVNRPGRKASASALLDYLASPEGKAHFIAQGFTAPGE